MNILPNEIQDEILSFLFKNKCCLEDKNSLNISICSLISKKFYSKFECKIVKFFVKDKSIKFCLTHDKILLRNIYNLVSILLLNYNNRQIYKIEHYISEDSKINTTLAEFNLEPYISIMDDNYYLRRLPSSKKKLDSINVVNIRFLNKVFSILNLSMRNIPGSNYEKLRRNNHILIDFIKFYSKLY